MLFVLTFLLMIFNNQSKSFVLIEVLNTEKKYITIKESEYVHIII